MSEASANGTSGGEGEPKGKPNPKDVLDEPIYGPDYVGPEHPFESRPGQHVSPSIAVFRGILDTVRVPARWIRENLVLPNKGPKYYYYHRKFPRALPIDECYFDDQACFYEANLEYRRIHMVDRYTLDLLRRRRDACFFWQATQKGKYFPAEECKDLSDTYDREEVNYHIKYGNLHYNAGAVHAYNKQKHRMIVDRRIALRKQQEAMEARN